MVGPPAAAAAVAASIARNGSVFMRRSLPADRRPLARLRAGSILLPPNPRSPMPKQEDDKFTFEAVVTEALPNAMFKVRLPNEQKTEVLAYVSGKMRMNYIRILPGDKVTVEMSPYDLTKARITYRH